MTNREKCDEKRRFQKYNTLLVIIAIIARGEKINYFLLCLNVNFVRLLSDPNLAIWLCDSLNHRMRSCKG